VAWEAIGSDVNGIASYETVAAYFGLCAPSPPSGEDLTLHGIRPEQHVDLLHWAGHLQESAMREKRDRDRARAKALARRFAVGGLSLPPTMLDVRRRSSPAALGIGSHARHGALPTVREAPATEDGPDAAFLAACAAMRHDDVRRAIAEGANVHATDARGESGLHKLARAASTAGAGLRTVRTLALLHELGVDVNARDMQGKTAAHLAATSGSSFALCFLLANGADARVTDMQGSTVLHACAANARPVCLRVVLETDRLVDLNAQDTMGRTALHAAACTFSVEIVAALVRRGAAPSIADARGLTAAHLASVHGSREVRAYLANIPAADRAAAAELSVSAAGVESTHLPPGLQRRRVTV